MVLFTYDNFGTRAFRMQVVLLINVMGNGYPCLVKVRLLSSTCVIFMIVTRIRIQDVGFSNVRCGRGIIITLRFARVFTSSIMIRTRRIAIGPCFASTRYKTAPLFRGGFICQRTYRSSTLTLPTTGNRFAGIAFRSSTSCAQVQFRNSFSGFHFPVKINTRMKGT